MSLTIFNGSPRGPKSNSKVISDWFLKGYGQEAETIYLFQTAKMDEHAKAFARSDEILMVFPLYVDGMPGQVKGMIEGLKPYKAQLKDKPITFIIHSGFQEGVQSRGLESFLNRFAEIFGMKNQGVAILPGSEGFRLMPPAMTKKKSQAVEAMGKAFRNGTPYTKEMLHTMNPKETLGKGSKVLSHLFSKLGLSNLYWKQTLKKNGAYEKRFDAPYVKGPIEYSGNGYYTNRK